uniref:Uncharacterized protein n=1 Tax=Arundo donax TaxID=35708 RepID=A0A0A9CBI3_ARUDO
MVAPRWRHRPSCHPPRSRCPSLHAVEGAPPPPGSRPSTAPPPLSRGELPSAEVVWAFEAVGNASKAIGGASPPSSSPNSRPSTTPPSPGSRG